MFPGRLISLHGDQLCPSRSPDLSALDYFFWGNVKSKVYQNRPETLEDLKRNIRQVIAEISPEVYALFIASLSVTHRTKRR